MQIEGGSLEGGSLEEGNFEGGSLEGGSLVRGSLEEGTLFWRFSCGRSLISGGCQEGVLRIVLAIPPPVHPSFTGYSAGSVTSIETPPGGSKTGTDTGPLRNSGDTGGTPNRQGLQKKPRPPRRTFVSRMWFFKRQIAPESSQKPVSSARRDSGTGFWMDSTDLWGQTKPSPDETYKFLGFGDIHGPKPYKFIGLGDIHGPKPYKFIGLGDIPARHRGVGVYFGTVRRSTAADVRPRASPRRARLHMLWDFGCV
jgi:hypothetical protein